MFDIGFWELSIIAIIALLVIGPERLPAVARTVGTWYGKMQRFITSVKSDIEQELKASELKQIMDEQKAELDQLKQSLHQTQSELERVAAADYLDEAIKPTEKLPEPESPSADSATDDLNTSSR
ncbi:MAG TPA: twin-arginine translocase subunit TatB [Gammaproteobacteria bacterium]|nr:twin-arginine translocase subunit TatB [Gammaproteobacteria bacterium]